MKSKSEDELLNIMKASIEIKKREKKLEEARSELLDAKIKVMKESVMLKENLKKRLDEGEISIQKYLYLLEKLQEFARSL